MKSVGTDNVVDPSDAVNNGLLMIDCKERCQCSTGEKCLDEQKDKLENDPIAIDLFAAKNEELAALQKKKINLKQELKAYNMAFAIKHGRMPLKKEKEPIRHLYENYHNLRRKIEILVGKGPAPVVRIVNSNAPASYNTDMAFDCVALEEEKRNLHQIIHHFEREFFDEHQRLVSGFNDIKPIASKYRRYKEVKELLRKRAKKTCCCIGCNRQKDTRQRS